MKRLLADLKELPTANRNICNGIDSSVETGMPSGEIDVNHLKKQSSNSETKSQEKYLRFLIVQEKSLQEAYTPYCAECAVC